MERLELRWPSGRAGGGVKRGTYLGKNKEVFDAEVFAILRAIRLLSKRNETGRDYMVFSDAQTAIARVQHDRCGPAQVLARAVISLTDDLYDRGSTLAIRWTPSHEGVESNEQADKAAKRAAEGEDDEDRVRVPSGGQPCPPHAKDDRGVSRGNQEVGAELCRETTSVSTPPRGKATEGFDKD